MSDQTSATIFGELFERLAADHTTALPDGPHLTSFAEETLNLQRGAYIRSLSEHVYGMAWTYDFHQCQMDCVEALIVLGLAEERQVVGNRQIRYRNTDGTWPEWG
jgi:hypothetical protein